MVATTLVEALPGPSLAADLAVFPLPLLDEADLLDVAAAWERVRSWAEAGQNAVLVELGRRFDARNATTGWEARGQAEELGLALGVGAASASGRMQQAESLATRLPDTARALAEGTITGHHARLLAGATRHLDDATSRAVDAAVAADGREGRWRTPRQAEANARRHVVALDPDGAEVRHRRAVAERDVPMQPTDDGMATLWALLPAAEAQSVMAAIEARARATASRPGSAGPDGRTLAQRRADALADLAAEALAAPDAPRVHGRRPTVNVTVAWSTLVGCDDAPADLTGYGPIDAQTARRIASDPTATWRRLLTDPTDGRLLDHGRATYRPPADLAEHVIARDRVCRGPLCSHPAGACDLDHRTRWADNGVTAADNLDALCPPMHRLKDEGGWRHERDPETGASVWTTPLGRVVSKPVEKLPTGPPIERPADPASSRPPDPSGPPESSRPPDSSALPDMSGPPESSRPSDPSSGPSDST